MFGVRKEHSRSLDLNQSPCSQSTEWGGQWRSMRLKRLAGPYTWTLILTVRRPLFVSLTAVVTDPPEHEISPHDRLSFLNSLTSYIESCYFTIKLWLILLSRVRLLADAYAPVRNPKVEPRSLTWLVKGHGPLCRYQKLGKLNPHVCSSSTWKALAVWFSFCLTTPHTGAKRETCNKVG